MSFIQKNKKGFGMVESIIAVSIIAGFIAVLVGINNIYLKFAFSNAQQLKAYFLAEEGLEAVKSMRDQSWNANINPILFDTDYRLEFQGSSWQAILGPLEDEGFTRILRMEEVYRDANGNIGSSGTLDPNTRLIKVEVSWLYQGSNNNVELQTYLTNLFED